MARVQELYTIIPLWACVLFLMTYSRSTATSIKSNSLLLQKLEEEIQALSSSENIQNDMSNGSNKAVLMCGNKEEKHAKHRQKRYLIGRLADGTVNKWNTHQLTWAITQPSRQIDLSKQRRIISESLQVWSAVSPMRFTMVNPNSRPDITFKFARGRHGPSFDPVFDGRVTANTANIYGHAWGPGVDRHGIAGDVHIDDEDDWSEDHRLKGVMVHELGHSMGLSHSDDPEAIMFPVYRDTTELGNDDIRGIQFLYGSAGRPITVRPPPRTTPRPRQRPRTRRPIVTRRPSGGDRPYPTVTPFVPAFAPDSPCLTKNINAVVEDPISHVRGLFYVIMEDKVYHIMYDGTLLASSSVAATFPGVPDNPDVAFTVKESKSIIFIKDNQSWEWKLSGITEDSPKSLHHAQFPEKPAYAISLYDVEGKMRRYLFGETYWWSYFVEQPRSTPHYERRHFSRDLPHGVMFATTWTDNNLYVVSKDNYIVLDTARRSMIHDKPYEGKPVWLHPVCRSGVSPLLFQPSIFVSCLIAMAIRWTLQR